MRVNKRVLCFQGIITSKSKSFDLGLKRELKLRLETPSQNNVGEMTIIIQNIDSNLFNINDYFQVLLIPHAE